ncbi:MAG: hypothetical protein OXB89_04580 [Anaerolineaceae bacterium]|nr:hypothetical protein [Anaerolineaceae bacterium]
MSEEEPKLLSVPDIPEPDSSDIAYGIGRAVLSIIPLPISPIAEMMIRSPMDKRVDKWRIEMTKVVQYLNERLNEVELESLTHSEEFATTFLHVTRAAVSSHRKEKHEMLRNALLNSALPDAPEDDERTLFLNFVEEFSVAHVQVLKALRQTVAPSDELPISLESRNWRLNDALGPFFDFVGQAIPDRNLNFQTFLSILPDIHNKGLISNIHPEPHSASELYEQPKLTPFGRRFLAFLESPLDDETS